MVQGRAYRVRGYLSIKEYSKYQLSDIWDFDVAVGVGSIFARPGADGRPGEPVSSAVRPRRDGEETASPGPVGAGSGEASGKGAGRADPRPARRSFNNWSAPTTSPPLHVVRVGCTRTWVPREKAIDSRSDVRVSRASVLPSYERGTVANNCSRDGSLDSWNGGGILRTAENRRREPVWSGGPGAGMRPRFAGGDPAPIFEAKSPRDYGWPPSRCWCPTSTRNPPGALR